MNNLVKSTLVALLSIATLIAVVTILNAFIIGPDYILDFYNLDVLHVTIDKWHEGDSYYLPKV